MKLKINFKADEPTGNGRIYPKEVLKKAFEKRMEKPLFIAEKYDPKVVGTPVDSIIGSVEDYEIDAQNEIWVDILPMGLGKDILDENIKLTTFGYASLDSDNMVGEDYFLEALFIEKDDEDEHSK